MSQIIKAPENKIVVNGVERNWWKGAGAGAEMPKQENVFRTQKEIPHEAVIAVVLQLILSEEKKDELFFKRELPGDNIQIFGPGANLTITKKYFDEVVLAINQYKDEKGL